jgi:microcystin-dependent protein
MAIINPLPNNISNGDPLDAVPVMANFQQILTNVNANAAGLALLNTFTQPQNGQSAILPGQFTILSQVLALIAASTPTGTLQDFAGLAAPAGYAVCDGSAVGRTDPVYSNLFAVIGVTWGAGNGVSTFNLPNLIRRATIGSGGAGTAYIGNTVGSLGGEEVHVISGPELGAHTHGLSDPGHAHGVNDPTHFHTINDPGHAHGVSDPGHGHGIPSNYMSNNLTGGAFNPIGAQAYGVGGATSASSTGIGIYGAVTGVYNSYAATGISLALNGTNASVQSSGGNIGHNTMQPSAVVTKIIKL